MEVKWKRSWAQSRAVAFGRPMLWAVMSEAPALEKSSLLLCVMAGWETSCVCDIRAFLPLNEVSKVLQWILQSRSA